jgi:predicted acetyltransferase
VTWKPRLIDPGELDAVVDLTATAFGVGPVAPPDYRARATTGVEVDRTFVVDDGTDVVGTGAAYSFELALPGGTVPVAGVSEVGVRPSHRRRGILTALMDALFDQAIDRGEPLAALTASEGGIYRRFGYGVAARYQSVTVQRARSAELVTVPAAGQVRLVDEAEAEAALPAVWERHWRRFPGEVRRTPTWWRVLALDPESQREGASARFVAVHDDGHGAPDGFATYRIKHDWRAEGSRHQLIVEDVAAADDGVEAALVRYLLDVDLISVVHWPAAPLDLSLRWRLADSRALQVTAEADHLWLRPVDLARCLASRRYGAEGGLVVEVVDAARPALGGRFRLEAGAGGSEARCDRTDAEPEVALAMADIGALLLGGVSWATLRRAGLVDERVVGAVARADALFRTERAPFCGSDF